MSEYANTLVARVSRGGGAVRVTIASNVGQGNGGTSLPCRECYVVQGATSIALSSPVMVNIGAAASSILGILIPGPPRGTVISLADADGSALPPLRLPIDDVSDLYFWSATDGEVVDILYRY